MKKLLCILCLLLALVCVLAACSGKKTNTEQNDNDDNNQPSHMPFSVDLTGYVANIGNAVALGVAKVSDTGNSPVLAYDIPQNGTQLLSARTLESEKDSENKNYIVMSTTEYSPNAPETNQTGLKKVTFSKIVTENVTTEMTGTKHIVAVEGAISIPAIQGFKYSVYQNDALVYNEVQDNDEKDTEKKDGVIVLNNLLDNIEYRVEYKGVGKETTITQDDIDGEIDKLCVMNGYTFISFVPVGTSQRPGNTEEHLAYDKQNYYSNESRQSFVIDNKTGYVYPIKNVSINQLKNNLIVISGKIYDMRVTDTDELEFYSILQNETLTVYHYFKDRYGNKYIYNDFLDAFDEENQTVYYTEKNKYLFSKEFVVIEEYQKLVGNFQKSTISKDERYTFDIVSDHHGSSMIVIEDGYLYNVGEDSGVYKVDLQTFERENGAYIGQWIGADRGFCYNHKSIIICTAKGSSSGKSNLYIADLYGDNAIPHPDAFYYGRVTDMREVAELLLEDVVIDTAGGIFSCNSWRFRKTTLTETVYYNIVGGEDGLPTIVDERYVAPPQTVITLQPINK